ncbi:MAG: hypothetical protein ACRD3G_00900 [Vicinamibacterales bacterium]
MAVAIGVPPSAPAQGTGARGVDAGTEVPLVLERGRFLTPLPFDVQFFLVGNAPDDLVTAKGRFGKKTRAARTCDLVLPKPAEPGSGGVVAAATPRNDAVRIQQIEETKPFNNGQRLVFELSVDPLEPNEDYCFEFEMTYRIKPEELRAAVMEGIDISLQTVFGVEPKLAEAPAYTAFRKQAAQMIERIAKMKSAAKGIPIRVVPVTNAFFDLNTPTESLPLAFRQQFTEALLAQARQVAAIRSIGAASITAAAAAQRLLDDVNFRTMMLQVQARATEPALALQLTGVSSALTITERADIVRAAAEGLTPTSALTAPALPQVRTGAALSDRLSVIDLSMAEFAQLRDLAATLGRTPALATTAQLKLTADQLNAVAKLADEVRQTYASVRFEIERLQRALGERDKAIAALAEQASGVAAEIVPFQGNTTSDWETRAGQYVSADIGLARADPIDSTFFYLGTNIYIGPVNRRAKLTWSDQSFRKRFAFTFGIPLNPFEEDQTVDQFENSPQTIEGVIGNRPLLIGAGWRLTDLIRANGGIVMFRVKDANPLLDPKPRTHFTWYFGLSADWNLRGLFTSSFTGTPRSQGSPPPSE